MFGPDATKAELDVLAKKVRNDPRGWIAQPVVQLSTVPTKVGERMRPRHVDLRPFAVNDGESVWVLPGGLTRVALPEGSLVVNSSQGGGSKDTWVLAARGSGVGANSPVPRWSRPGRGTAGGKRTRAHPRRPSSSNNKGPIAAPARVRAGQEGGGQ